MIGLFVTARCNAMAITAAMQRCNNTDKAKFRGSLRPCCKNSDGIMSGFNGLTSGRGGFIDKPLSGSPRPRENPVA
jgi:hypothetical protein